MIAEAPIVAFHVRNSCHIRQSGSTKRGSYGSTRRLKLGNGGLNARWESKPRKSRRPPARAASLLTVIALRVLGQFQPVIGHLQPSRFIARLDRLLGLQPTVFRLLAILARVANAHPPVCTSGALGLTGSGRSPACSCRSAAASTSLAAKAGSVVVALAIFNSVAAVWRL